MKFVDCIKQIVKKEGSAKIAQRSFIGMLEDYQAFEDEAYSFKLILKHWCENGKMEKISKMSPNDSQWKINVSDIIHQTESEGFKEEVVSDLLHKILLGMGIIDSKFDWNKAFLPQKTTEKPKILAPQSSHTKRETKEETYTKEIPKQEKIDEEWEKLQQQQQKEKRKAEKAAKKKQEKERKKALLKSAISKREWERSKEEEQIYKEYLKEKEFKAKSWWGTTLGLSILCLVSILVYCYCKIVGSENDTFWGELSLSTMAIGIVSAIIGGFVTDQIMEVFWSIAFLMAAVLIVSLLVIFFGWISGSGHDRIWNLLCLISICLGVVLLILSEVLDNFFNN